MGVRPVVSIVVVALSIAACGSAGPLDGVGDLSDGWVHRGSTTTAPIDIRPSESGGEGLVATTDLLWLNDDIEGVAGATAAEIIARVRERWAGSRFIQSSRAEIAVALPTLMFPEFVPDDVRWVTSQLVYDGQTGTLDLDTSVAFGFWRVEPYTVNEGRIAVLRVGAAPSTAVAGRSAVVPIVVPDGISLGWTEGDLRYELFCRAPVSEELCREIVESFTRIGGLLQTAA
jgi:hypothetical protein